MSLQKSITVAVQPLKHTLEIQGTHYGGFKLSGFEGKFLEMILSELGFRYKLIIPEDGEWGRLKNGNWTGLIGMVHRGEADMAMTYLSITEKRIQAVNFSVPYASEDTTFVTDFPGELPGTATYLRPFDATVWLSCFGLLLVMPLIFGTLLNWKYSYMHLFMKVYGTLLKQPLILKNAAFIIRLLFGFWCILSMFISMSYTAVLASFLTVPLMQEPLKDVQELAEAVANGKYKCFAARGSSDLELLMNSDEKYLKELGESITSNHWFLDAYNGIRTTLLDGNYAILGPRTQFQFQFGKERFASKLISKNSFSSVNYALALKRNFCCRERLNTVLTRLRSAGLYHKLLEDEFYRAHSFDQNKTSETGNLRDLQLNDVIGALISLLLGYALSIIVAITEIIYYNLKK